MLGEKEPTVGYVDGLTAAVCFSLSPVRVMCWQDRKGFSQKTRTRAQSIVSDTTGQGEGKA